MTELNHNLRGLALGGIRRFTTLAKERGDCILLTLGEPGIRHSPSHPTGLQGRPGPGAHPLHGKPGRPGPAPGHFPI